MFKAWVFVVYLNGATQSLQDQRGPYTTELECYQRIEQMNDKLRAIAPVMKFNGVCRAVSGTYVL